jgi:error-prone DNA polymerase
VANVITYRPRSAVRDMGKASGTPEQVDAWAKGSTGGRSTGARRAAPDRCRRWWLSRGEVLDFPRHLGIHSGGMVICDRPVVEVCPVEWARMPGRSVLQWDKDDCAASGWSSSTCSGWACSTALHRTGRPGAPFHGVEVDLARLPQEDEVYDMLCRADTVGVFQVESRAQMATLPRLKPRCFYDLAIEVALIRPGPIQGGSVHPYIRRRRGEERSPTCTRCSSRAWKTLGVPLFQEQLMQMAIDVAGFTPAEADELRQAMGQALGERMARCGTGSSPGWPSGASTGAVAERSSTSWPPSPTSGSPRATRCPSPTSSTPRPG